MLVIRMDAKWIYNEGGCETQSYQSHNSKCLDLYSLGKTLTPISILAERSPLVGNNTFCSTLNILQSLATSTKGAEMRLVSGSSEC